MKIFFGFALLCALVGGTFGMNQEGRTEEEQAVLDIKLYEAAKYTENSDDAVCTKVQDFLNQGANPNSGIGLCALRFAVSTEKSRLVTLLLTHANSNLAQNECGTPITWASDIATIQALVHAGADINAIRPLRQSTLLNNLCNFGPNKKLFEFVWALSHGANPNIGLQTPLENALCNNDFEKVIALLQFDADLDIKTKNGETLFAFACNKLKNLYYGSDKDREQYALLRAIKEYGLNPRLVYSIDEYEKMLCFPEYAQHIRETTIAINHTILSTRIREP